ncbi:MAG: hypothetical protein AAGG75_25625 [Bacteroidota bacterium]
MKYTDNELFILCEEILAAWGIKVSAVARASGVAEEKIRSLKRRPPKSSADAAMLKGLLYYFGTVIMEVLEDPANGHAPELIDDMRTRQQEGLEERGAVSLIRRFEDTDKKLDLLLEEIEALKKREGEA